MALTTTLTDGTTSVNTALAQNAYLISGEIYTTNLNTDFWDAMLPKSTLPTGVGEALVSLIYNASLPTTTAGGSTVGLNWTPVKGSALAANSLNTVTPDQVVAGAGVDTKGTLNTSGLSFVTFNKTLQDYGLDITHIRAPWMDANDFRTAAQVVQQVAALTQILAETVKWGWDRRHQESYEKGCGCFVPCLTASTPILTTVDIKTGKIDPVTGSAATEGTANNPFYRLALTDMDLNTSGASNADVIPTAYISNKIMDKIWNRLWLTSSAADAYGKDNAKPVWCAVMSSDASYALKTESGIRDDVRKSTMVDSLIKPLGIEESFRGFYHMVLPDMPRFTESSGALTRIEPLDALGDANPLYDTATYEALYIVHKKVMEVQVPGPTVTSPGISLDPVSYRGEWKWVNNKDNVANLLGDKGFFFGTMAAANKPIKPVRGFVVLFKRTVTTPAA